MESLPAFRVLSVSKVNESDARIDGAVIKHVDFSSPLQYDFFDIPA
jgi:hypothetical protein